MSYAASVYLNGTLVAEHEGGHTPFAVDASPVILPGARNLLAVRVYRRPWYRQGLTGPDAISCRTELPHKPVDYWPYAGITRGVFIEATAQVTVSKLITSAGDGRLAAAAVVFNHGAGPARRRLILDPGEGTGGAPVSRELALAPGEVRAVSAELPIPGARPWSPADPRLYRLTARLEADGAVGRRAAAPMAWPRATACARWRWPAARLCLNGEPVFLKGLNWHEETPERGRAMRRPDYDQLLDTAADLGANFLRNCGYTRHPDFYRAADEHGMLVCDETDNFWVESGQQRSRAATACPLRLSPRWCGTRSTTPAYPVVAAKRVGDHRPRHLPRLDIAAARPRPESIRSSGQSRGRRRPAGIPPST